MFQKNKYRIKELCQEGKTVKEISKLTGVVEHIVQRNLKKAILNHAGNIELGHRDEPYYETEEEMLNEVEYNFNNLSDGEKEIYNQREKDGELGRYFTSTNGLYGGH
jgi:hypothetical protein